MTATTFTDSQGRQFEAVVTLAEVSAAKSGLGLDLGDFREGGWLDKVASDYELLGNLLWLVYQKSATQHGLTVETFPAILAGDVFDAAQTALVEAAINFCPSPQKRAAIRKLLQSSEAAMGLLMDEANQAVESLTPEKILESLKRVGDTPASSESTPAA